MYPADTEIYTYLHTLSLDDALPIYRSLTGRQVGADIGETAFIGRLALRIGIAAAQVEAETVEPELADELGVDQLAFVPGGVLFHDVAVGLVAVGAEREPRLLERVADIEAGPAQFVIDDLEPEAEQAAPQDAGTDAHPAATQSPMRTPYGGS